MTPVVIAAIAAVPLLLFTVAYNGLVGRKNGVENAFASIDAQLKKRWDLIPGLVETAKQYAAHERGTLTEVAELRTRAQNAGLSTEDKVGLANQLSGKLRGLMVQLEAYPDLKASENFTFLQRSLNEIEEQISASRRAYNAAVTAYNNSVEMFPTNMVAGIIGYARKTPFEIAEAERQAPDVKQLFKS